ncbi:MAG: pilin [Patescibacteria group bacterium]|jgi:hypothetical protein
MKKTYKQLISLAIVSTLVLPVVALAQANFGLNEINNGLNNSLTSSDPRTVIGRVINIALSFLGVIAVGIILIGGFKWMTAAGNEEKTSEAKKLLGAGVIGLVIILASWGIATYLLSTFASQLNG